MQIRKADPTDSMVLAKLASNMWDSDPGELAAMFAGLTASDAAACFLACADEQPVGFSQCQLRRDYVEGTESSPVGYLEGVWVDPRFQRQGIAKALVSACEDWTRSAGCTEFASDCELTNTDSLAFHLAVGFTEANRIICFTKQL